MDNDDGHTVGGAANATAGLISTRSGSGAPWLDMLGKVPFGRWTLDLSGALPEPDGRPLSVVFEQEEVEDILFVLTYTGRTPEWPE